MIVEHQLIDLETLRGHHGSALSHIKSGVKIISEVESKGGGEQKHGVLMTSPHPFVDFQDLEIRFNRLDAQVSQVCPYPDILALALSVHRSFLSWKPLLIVLQMIGTPPMFLEKRPRDIEKGFCSEVPAAFTALEQARNSLDYQWNNCIEFLNEFEKISVYEKSTAISRPLEILRTIDTTRQDIFDFLKRWLFAFQAFLQNQGKLLDTRGLQAARTLQVSHSFAMIYLNVTTVNVFNDETAWDKFTHHFEDVVNLAALIVEPLTCDKSDQKRGHDFTLDMNTVAPLYAVAHKCRHPIVRRKAVSLLYKAPRQEGIWDSVVTARVAERLIGIEESGLGNVTCCEDVPDWARISDVEVKFDLQERLGTVKYSRQRSPLERVRDAVVDSIRW